MGWVVKQVLSSLATSDGTMMIFALIDPLLQRGGIFQHPLDLWVQDPDLTQRTQKSQNMYS